MLHGTNDSLVPVEQARTFVDELRKASTSSRSSTPSCPGAQHAFEMFPSVRTHATVHAVERFLAVVRSEHGGATPAEAVDSPVGGVTAAATTSSCSAVGRPARRRPRQAAFWGKRVALVDRQRRPGGAMVGGAVSSKTMREAALYLTGFQRRDTYEVGIELTPEVATERLRRRTDDVVQMMTDSAVANLRRHGVDVVHGDGVTRAWTLGGRAARRRQPAPHAHGRGDHHHHRLASLPPAGRPLRRPDVLDSDAAALLDRPLRSLVVVGGGAVGCEFASIFTALGAEVTLVDSGPRLLPFMDARDRRAAGDDVPQHGDARASRTPGRPRRRRRPRACGSSWPAARRWRRRR